MNTEAKQILTVAANINAPIEKVWEYWSQPEHIMKWNSASDDWHTPKSENDLRTGGSFSSRMEAKDGSMGFDFGGVYDEVRPHEYIEYTLGDGRKVTIDFNQEDGQTVITEKFEAETQNAPEMQQQGWQMIMDSFKRYTENN